MSECYYDAAGCLICPEQQAQEYIPSRLEQRAVLGWTAGANSIIELDGGLRALFTQPLGVIGIVLGLKGGRQQQTIPSQIAHGWYFQKVSGLNIAQPIERGAVVGTPFVDRADDTVFEIRRAASGVVTYAVDGLKVWTSITRSVGPRVLNCCLFASGDTASSGVAPPAGGGEGGGGEGGGDIP